MASKYRFLSLGAEYEQVPIYDACGYNGCVPLFKTLISSKCQNNCLYCMFRSDRNARRFVYKPEEIANITLKLKERGAIRGLFLSSAVHNDPEDATNRAIEAVTILRKWGYTDYVHLRLMPGCSRESVKRAVEVADRVGVNFEAYKEIFSEICPDENWRQDLWKRQRWITHEVERYDEKDIDTQFVVGAVEDFDFGFLKLTDKLYREYGLKRVYYSGFAPVNNTPLEDRKPENTKRIHRLYQASFLIRDYGISYKELIFEEGNLPNEDPKEVMAREMGLRINPNEAPYRELLLVPGIGPKTAKKIITERPIKNLSSFPKKSHRYLTLGSYQTNLLSYS